MDGRPTVRRNLAHWLVHVTASAAASFWFAYHVGWDGLLTVVGMLAGVAFFIALYTWVWSTDWFHHHVPPGSAGRRALFYGTWVRSALGLLGFLSMLLDNRPHTFGRTLSVFFVPDLWAGVRACELITTVLRVPPARALIFPLGGANVRLQDGNVFFGGIDSLVPTFFITVAEGLLLTVVLLMLSGFCRVLFGLYARLHPTPPPAVAAF